MNISGIYQIQSKIKPEKTYIGSAVNIQNRWLGHLGRLRNNKHHSPKLQSHYNKYGEYDLQFSILLGCEKEDLIKHEQFFIDSLNPWFNCSLVAGSMLGYKHSDETKNKVSKAGRGKPKTEEHNRKNSESNKGKIPWNKGLRGVYSEESLNLMSKAKTGKERSGDTKYKLRIANLGKITSEDTKIKISIANKEAWVIRRSKTA
jgi:group I intron endonuclease